MTESAQHATILKVALDVPLDGVFDYRSDVPVQVGQRVVVPFGPRKQVGIVVDIADNSEIAPTKLKSILQHFNMNLCLMASFSRC